MTGMKKSTSPIKKKAVKNAGNGQLNDPALPYFKKSIPSAPLLKDFSYTEFKKIADKSPFTQAEWAAMLHLSERTLQRYAKNEGSFAPMNAERVLQIAKVLEQGKITFGKVESFYSWLKAEPYMLEGNLSINDLSTYDGIQKILIQLGRIQHGILA